MTKITHADRVRFDNHLCTQGDLLDNAVHQMLCTISEQELDWDISDIREVLDFAIDTLAQKGVNVCNPYHECDGGKDPVPCYLCKNNNCDKGKCPMRK